MERKLLQIAVAIAGLTGVGLGLTGVVFGTLHADLSGDVVLDSYVRFAKGVLLAIGLVYWSCVAQIERCRHPRAEERRVRRAKSAQDRCRNAGVVVNILQDQPRRGIGRDDESRHPRSKLAGGLSGERHGVDRWLYVVVKSAVLVIDDHQHRLLPFVI